MRTISEPEQRNDILSDFTLTANTKEHRHVNDMFQQLHCKDAGTKPVCSHLESLFNTMFSLSINTHQTSALRTSARQKKPFLHLPTNLVHVYQVCRNISYAIPPSHQSPYFLKVLRPLWYCPSEDGHKPDSNLSE